MAYDALISIQQLIKDYPMGRSFFRALNEINLEIESGEFAGLVGPSGSGKTTLLNIIGSLDVPTKGDAYVLGQSVGSLSSHQSANLRNHHLGFIFQTYNLLPVYNVFENVELPLLLLKIGRDERRKLVDQALEWVGLQDKRKSRPAQLSGGECQRVSIARAMVKSPKIVMADEPTANLDAMNSHNILQTMEKLNRDLKTTFIFATHDDKVIQYLHRKISLNDGKVVGDELISKQ
ncbi:MAG: lipoprotein-releasing system ATP-binding protein LolD [Candidatus Marinimicrobia bacterium CG08_land_8_20_14_0_20_45_22]|nr:MAG: lipoprotein-releasing system ATP-binding protein LolD [Candidatus Marinimicrobia bacterium CG08_land_8_20_14_0_20_45_22]